MKTFLMPLVMILLLCRAAYALHSASREDRERIIVLLDDAEQTQKDVDDIAAALRSYREHLKFDLSQGTPANVREDRDEIENFQEQLESRMDHLTVARDKAIHLALTAYGIVPADADGVPIAPAGVSSMPDEERGLPIVWTPRAQDNDQMRPYWDNHGRQKAASTGHQVFALTGSDGMTVVDQSAFRHGPAFLALILSHELIHFQQYTTPGWGSNLTVAEQEVDAWKRTKGNIATLGLAGKAKAFAIDLADYNLKRYESDATQEKMYRWTLGLFGHSQKPALIHEKAQISEARARFDDISRIVAQEISLAREEARREQDDAAKNAVIRVARLACADVNNVTQQDLDSIPTPADSSFVVGDFPGSDKCEMRLFLDLGMILGGGKRLTLDDVRNDSWFLAPVALAPAPAAKADPTTTARDARDLALKICANPASIGEGDLAICGIWAGPYATLPGFDEYEASLTGCVKVAYDKLASALARRCPHDAGVAERFELYACGVELANGFGELTDAAEQRARLIAAMGEKQQRYGAAWPLDEDFLAALALMPPASGVALGLDRLAMLASGARHINDVLWTPA